MIQQIAGLNVPMHNLVLVQIAESIQHLHHDIGDLFFSKGDPLILHDVHKRTTFTVLKKDPDLLFKEVDSVALDDVGVVAGRHQLNLELDGLQLCLSRLG